MIPLSAVNQGRYDSYTVVTIDSDKLVTLNLRDYFINKIGRAPRPNESIRYVVLDYVDVISTSVGYRLNKDSCAVYVRPSDFTKDNKIIIENYGKLLGRGGNGRSQVTAATSVLGSDNGRYTHKPAVTSHGGHAIYNESPAIINVVNYGIVGGGGGGGAAIGNNSWRNGDWFWSTPITWWVEPLNGGGGGGAPYGKGGLNAQRLEDFFEGTYDNVMTDQEKIKTVVRISKPGTVGLRPYYPGPRVQLFDLLDSTSTPYTVPLTANDSNYLAMGIILLAEVQSPAGSAHRQFYSTELNGPDKDRIYFNKSLYSIKNGGSRYSTSQTLYTIGAPKFHGATATLTAPGAAGYSITEDITSRSSIRKGYVPAYGGIGGNIGKSGKKPTTLGDIKLRSASNGSVTKTITQLNAEGIKTFSDSAFLSYSDTGSGNPGYINSGGVIIENKGSGKSLGRIDVLNMTDVFKQFGNITAIRYFDVTVSLKDTVSYEISKVTMRDKLNPSLNVNITTYEQGSYFGGLGFLFFANTLSKVTLSRNSQLPAGNDSYLVLNEYGIHDDEVLLHTNLTSTTLEISGIAHIGHPEAMTTHPELKSAPVVIIAAPAAVIAKIRAYILSLGFVKFEMYDHSSMLY